VGDENFLTLPGAYPASYTTCTGSFQGVNRPGSGVEHPPTYSVEIKERVELYLYPNIWAFVACYGVNFTCKFYLYLVMTVNLRVMNFEVLSDLLYCGVTFLKEEKEDV
jgi:hypothetical protein